MTKEEIYNTFLEDPILSEIEDFDIDKIAKLKMYDETGIKLLEVIKIAISSYIDGDTENVTNRKINKYLNK